ncbi:Molybdenum cofactor guanylyltransferase [Paenibacillus plantiphilus]|uniref:Molybdenum cofactor guanylyltransferase n=1 Tax=Paenibacillus plantiphilus TaxID=2905650 RepID=A0ABN8H285_9BACL|nr:molybdenum cofactor guanylyltransferase [Paenibacillus plantiphilus]CAH1224990.1 Molybdenum cofactor guanylyltransferase [Paenibacillus plantiphilus]
MLTGLILAGGPQRRMKEACKPLLEFGGECLLQRQVREMRSICSEVIVAAEDPRPLLRIVDRDVRIITDYYPGKGPLGGMHAGLSLARNRAVWVVGCGMPFLSARAALLLLGLQQGRFDAAVPVICGIPSPLHGIYDKDCAEEALALIERGERQMIGLLKELAWVEAYDYMFEGKGIDTLFVQNIRTWEQYQDLLKRAGLQLMK